MSYGQGRQSAFATNESSGFGHGFNRDHAAEEDLTVYNWGDAGNLLDGDDDALNDETFGGDVADIASDFQWAAPAPVAPPVNQQSKPRGPIASTQSRYKPKVAHDPFAASEDDFYAPRPSKTKAAPAAKKPTAPVPQPPARQPAPPSRGPPVQAQPQYQDARAQQHVSMSQPMWGAAPSSSVRPPPGPAQQRQGGPPPAGQIKTLEEIEAEMMQGDMGASTRPPASGPPPPTQPQIRSLEEIEREMMGLDDGPAPAPAPALAPAQGPITQAPREDTPVQSGLAGSGYAKQQALLDSMFPAIGQAPAPGQQAPAANFPGATQPGPDHLARAQALHERITAKIKAMSTYNNCMGSSDKDFITRIQLSQLATADPYTSDFYAQVYTVINKNRHPGPGPEEHDGPTVVKVGQGAGFGVGGPTGNRFGQMGNKTMQKLSSQVKKLVEQRNNRQMSNDALQGALGRVHRVNAAAPRPVLAVPTSKASNRQVPQLNQDAGIRRQALTRKQVLVSIESLYDAILDLEQTKRDRPSPDQAENWSAACQAKADDIWRRTMVMEPLDVSDPHPFISLLNPLKGQRMFSRVLQQLNHQQHLTVLTLLIATYYQLDVVARAPPPPVADSSMLTKADRKDRARREADTDHFLQCILPGLDMIINQCNLGLISGLLSLCAQRMDMPRVASTRPGVALFTALLSRGQSLTRASADPSNPQQPQNPDPAEVDHWNRTFAYFLSVLLPRLPELFPSSMAQKSAFGPGAYLLNNDIGRMSYEMERRESEVWGFAAVMAVNAPEEEQTNLVGALRETILHTVQAARNPSTPAEQADLKLKNVNMFLNGLGLDASMIE